METSLDPKKLNARLIYLLENWQVEEAIELACEVWDMIIPGDETDLLRCLVGAEENLPMSEDDLYDLRKIALHLAAEYRESQLPQLSQLQEVDHDC